MLKDSTPLPIRRQTRLALHLFTSLTGDIPVMSKDELIIQLLKIALGIAIGAYFVWWSLEVLHRLPPH